MSENNGIPQFDYSDLSWDESIEVELIQIKIRQAQAANDAEAVRAAYDSLKAMYAKITRYIPRDWLVSSAADEPDLSDPKTYGKLRRDRAIEFLTLAVSAQASDATSKN